MQTIHPSRTVQEAVHQLVTHAIGSLLVEDEQAKIVGIITERDILRLCAERSHLLDRTLVGAVMTTDLIVGKLESKVSDLLDVMTQRRVRHLPIMNQGALVGLVSIGDLVKAQLEETAFENKNLKQYIQGA